MQKASRPVRSVVVAGSTVATTVRRFSTTVKKLRLLTRIALCAAVLAGATVLACQGHLCSNDSLKVPIYGDEMLAWDYDTWVPLDYHTSRCFEVMLYPSLDLVRRNCEVYSECSGMWELPPAYLSPYAVDPLLFPREGELVQYKVRGCTLFGCGDWPTEPVEFIGAPYACFGADASGRCEDKCYEEAPLRFPELRECLWE